MGGWRFVILQARPIQGLEVARDVEVCRQEEMQRLRALAGASRRVWSPTTWVKPSPAYAADVGYHRQVYEWRRRALDACTDFGYLPSARVCKEGFLELILRTHLRRS